MFLFSHTVKYEIMEHTVLYSVENGEYLTSFSLQTIDEA
jgi:hypothetical protein